MAVNPTQLRQTVDQAIEKLIESAKPYHGLLPSMLDRHSGRMLEQLPPAILGQRDGDRAFLGSNLIHDEALLLTMLKLDEALGRPHYRTAVETYLHYFASHCTNTTTGLFPWGEHSYWHLNEDRVGNSYVDAARRNRPPENSIHDHLRQAPLWLWQHLHAANADAVQRFAAGLDYHFTTGPREEYIRHAFIQIDGRLPQEARSCDFPRHSGFYIFDLAFAYQQSGNPALLTLLQRFHDYWWPRRDERNLLQIESRSPEDADDFYQINAPGQTLSLGTSLLEAALLLEVQQPTLAANMRWRAASYIDGFFNTPHNPKAGVFVISSHRQSNTVKTAMPIWGSIYGVWPASYVALTCLCAHKLLPDERLLRWAEAVAEHYAQQVFPANVAVPAMDAGLGLGLLAELYARSGETRWLNQGLALAEVLLARYFDDTPLPRGAAGIAWYESQMGPGFLLHGLARLALLAEDREGCPLPADFTAR